MSLWVIEHDSFQGGHHEDLRLRSWNFQAPNLDAMEAKGIKVNDTRIHDEGSGYSV
jgi:hypothetical protein